MNKMKPAVFATVLLGSIALMQAANETHNSAELIKVPEKIPLKAEPFSLSEVQLLESPFKRVQDVTRQMLLNIDSDRLLYPFRREAKIPSPVKGPDNLHYSTTGHTLGHYLSGCAQLYRNTGDAEIKKKADALVASLSECQEKMGNGYLGGFPEGTILDPKVRASVPWYCLHKIYAGLLDMHVLTGNQQALEVLKKAADWVERSVGPLPENQMQDWLGTEHGGMNEVLANLYAVTGEEKHLNLSHRFNHRSVLEPFANGEDRLDDTHANTQIPKFIGAARQYLLTGNEKLNTIATSFWEAVTRDRSYVTGGNSLHERFTPKGHLSHAVAGWTTETCNEYNMLRLTRYLLGVDPKASYADYYERTLFNHILSSRHPETGGQLYFQILQSGHYKGEKHHVLGWRFLYNEKDSHNGTESACCSGSGLESTTKFADSIYFHQGTHLLYVNQFIPSELDWKAAGVKVRQETQYPEQGATKLTFTCDKPVAFKLQIRHPWWATKEFQVAINGKQQKIASTPGSYAAIERTWNTGDKVEISMPMHLWVEGFKDNPNRVAVMYGPLVMAAVTDHGNPFSAVASKDERFLKSLKPVDGKPLEFTGPASVFRTSPFAVGDKPVVFRPLHTFFGDSYAVYWDVLTPNEFQKQATLLETEVKRHQAVEPQTVDVMLCGLKACTLSSEAMITFQSYYLTDKVMPRPFKGLGEAAHGYKAPEKKPTRRPPMEAYGWLFAAQMPFNLVGEFRSVDPGTPCAYQMKVLPDKDQQLEVRLWKSQFFGKASPLKLGVLEVVVEGKVIGTCDASALPAGEFSVAAFPLPADLTKGKEKVELQLRVAEGSAPVHGVYECRVLTKTLGGKAARCSRIIQDAF